MTQQEYIIDLDVIDYKITLDSSNQIQSIYSRNRHFTKNRENPDFNPRLLMDALHIMYMYDFEQFESLSKVLQNSDVEMFQYASIVANKFDTM